MCPPLLGQRGFPVGVVQTDAAGGWLDPTLGLLSGVGAQQRCCMGALVVDRFSCAYKTLTYRPARGDRRFAMSTAVFTAAAAK